MSWGRNVCTTELRAARARLAFAKVTNRRLSADSLVLEGWADEDVLAAVAAHVVVERGTGINWQAVFAGTGSMGGVCLEWISESDP